MIYRDGITMIHDTGEFPKGMKNVLTICKVGTHPDHITEELRDVKQLAKLERVDDLDPAWRTAFGLPDPVDGMPTSGKKAMRPKRRTPRMVKRQEVVEEVEVVEESPYTQVSNWIMQEFWSHGVLSLMMAPVFIPLTLIYLAILWVVCTLGLHEDEDTVDCSVKVAR